MPTPGRNDPCPCGSGRKFKHCCGNAALPMTGLPTAADRSAGYDLLDRIASLPRFADDVSLAFALIWQGIPSEDVGRLVDTPARDLFLEWVWFDFQLHTGHTIADFALERYAAEVGPRSKAGKPPLKPRGRGQARAARQAKEGEGFDVSYLRSELGLPRG